jgi:LacI family transcriptional regulator
VRTPIIEIGHAAADQLIARLEGEDYAPQQSFPIEVVHRGSTAPPRKARKTARRLP